MRQITTWAIALPVHLILFMPLLAASLPSKAVGEAPRYVETGGLTSAYGEKTILDLSPMPSPEESDLPEIYLVPDCHDCASVAEIGLASSIWSLNRKPFKVVTSQLILMDAHGEALFSITDPYHFDGNAEISQGTSGIGSPEFIKNLAALHVDSYTAVLKVNELYSNVVSFNVRATPQDFGYSDGPSCLGLLSIEPLVGIHGKALPNAFMFYFRNISDHSVFVAGSTMNARLLVDGKEYQLGVLRWAGIGDLGAGKSWGSIVYLPSFVSDERKKIAAGRHEIQYRFGDCLSNTIQVTAEGR